MYAIQSSIVCVLVSVSLVVDNVPGLSAATPGSSSPPNSQLDAIRNSQKCSLGIEITTLHNISACGGYGWKRVAFLNMTNPDQTCPTAWRLYEQDSIRACGRQESNTGSCDSVLFSTGGYEYTQVCGRIIGYQYGSPDGVYYAIPARNIDSAYVDGITVTHGSPRQHIWTLYASVNKWCGGCCPLIVGTNYFCDTSNPTDRSWFNVLFVEHHLWDGIANCASSTCYAPQSGPWFHAEISLTPIADDIEIRICGDEPTSNEDTPVELVEIYVKQ